MTALTVLQNVRTVQLTRGYVALVDEVDYPAVIARNWQANLFRGVVYAKGAVSIPRTATTPYRQVSENMHRFLMKPPRGHMVDHANGDGLDNRRANLRVCTRAANAQNQRRTYGRSKYKGIVWNQDRWVSRIQSPDGIRISLGRFRSEKDAARAYDRAAIKLYGEFAATNAELFGDLDEST